MPFEHAASFGRIRPRTVVLLLGHCHLLARTDSHGNIGHRQAAVCLDPQDRCGLNHAAQWIGSGGETRCDHTAAGVDPENSSNAEAPTVCGGPKKVSINAGGQSVLWSSAGSVVEIDQRGQCSIRHYAEHSADKAGPSYGSGAIEITGGIHRQLALWIATVGALERGEGGECSIGREAEDRPKGAGTAQRGGAVKVPVFPQRQPPLRRRPISCVEREQ